jgi:hypothetical protein
MVINVDLRSARRYPPLNDKTPEQLFDLGVQMARTMRRIRVRAPVSEQPDETVVLDGHLLSRKGVEVY